MNKFLPLLLLFACQFCVAQVAIETDSVDKDYSSELVRTAAMTPQESLRSFRIQSGFRVELAASEPNVSDPVAMAFDEHGRLFVVEMRGYSEQPEDELGRIRLLEDKDHDGHYETASTFVSGLSWPTAIACYDGGVIVGCPPDILYCKDTTGDGKSDKQGKWFSGFGRQNVQGMMNSFVWGLDGRLYGTSSSNGGLIRSLLTDVGEVELRRRDFAIRFGAEMQLEAVSGGGQHGMSFDVWGDRYVSSNSNHLQWIEFEDRYQRRNPHLTPKPTSRSIAIDGPAAEVYRASPVEPWREVRTRLRVKGMVGGPVEGGGRAAGYFTGATGVTIYTGDAFPREFQQHTHAFVGDVGGNLVHHKVIETKGLSKVARRVEQQSEFLASPDNWFRPVQFANGPDGCLYILDMYRETIEHPLSLHPVIKRHLDLTSGRNRGRIYRVAANSQRHTKRALPGDADRIDKLLEMLGHVNGWHRDTAQRMILTSAFKESKLARPDTVDKLNAFASKTQDEQALVRSLYCLAALDGLDDVLITRTAGHSSWWVRLHGIRLAERLTASPLVREQIEKLANDPDIRVRYQLVLSLSKLEQQLPITPILVAIAQRDSGDAKMRHAILCAISKRWATMANSLLQHDKSLSQHAYFQLTEETLRQLGQSGDDLTRTAAEIWRTEHPRRLHLLSTLLAGIGKRGSSLVTQLEMVEERSSELGLPSIESVLETLIDDARRIAEDPDSSLAMRSDAIQDLRLANFDSITATLDVLLHQRQPDEMREQAIELIASHNNRSAARLLLRSESSLSPGARRRVYDLLCSRSGWAEELMSSIEKGAISASSIGAQHRQRLLTHRDQAVRSRAEELLGAVSPREEVVTRFQEVLSMSGDTQRGQNAFQKLCASCHRLDGVGHEVGPDLHPLRNRGAAFMMTNILDPNREIDERFVGYTIVDDRGRVHVGIVAARSDQSITLKSSEGKATVIPRGEIDELRATGLSLMPEGLEKDFDQQSLADIIAYLISR